MLLTVVLFALCGVALSQDASSTTAAPHHVPHNPLLTLIRQEIHALLQANPHMTVIQCAEKCDAEFALTSQHAEDVTTHDCHMECDRIIHNLHQTQQQN